MWALTTLREEKLSCDNFELEAEQIPDLLSRLQSEFYVEYDTGASGLDVIAMNFLIEREKVKVGWDNWSGVYIMADNVSANAVVEKVYNFLSREQVKK